jgi:hypothetical protein
VELELPCPEYGNQTLALYYLANGPAIQLTACNSSHFKNSVPIHIRHLPLRNTSAAAGILDELRVGRGVAKVTKVGRVLQPVLQEQHLLQSSVTPSLHFQFLPLVSRSTALVATVCGHPSSRELPVSYKRPFARSFFHSR